MPHIPVGYLVIALPACLAIIILLAVEMALPRHAHHPHGVRPDVTRPANDNLGASPRLIYTAARTRAPASVGTPQID